MPLTNCKKNKKQWRISALFLDLWRLSGIRPQPIGKATWCLVAFASSSGGFITRPIGKLQQSVVALLVAFPSQLEILLVELTEPRSQAMPLTMPLTPSPLAGSKNYYAAGQMPLTSQLEIVLVQTKCHQRIARKQKAMKKCCFIF